MCAEKKERLTGKGMGESHHTLTQSPSTQKPLITTQRRFGNFVFSMIPNLRNIDISEKYTMFFEISEKYEFQCGKLGYCGKSKVCVQRGSESCFPFLLFLFVCLIFSSCLLLGNKRRRHNSDIQTIPTSILTGLHQTPKERKMAEDREKLINDYRNKIKDHMTVEAT